MKLCGRNEKCFVPGPEWGHLEGVLCHFLNEDEKRGFCGKDNSDIQVYTTKTKYDILTSKGEIMKTLYATVGLPRSGKSTWAKQQNMPIVNPDSIRLALHGQPFLKDAESMVWTVAKYMVKALFIAGHDEVILDATCITQKIRDDWKSSEWETNFILFDTSKKECIERAKKDNKEYLIPIIEQMEEKENFRDTVRKEEMFSTFDLI